MILVDSSSVPQSTLQSELTPTLSFADPSHVQLRDFLTVYHTTLDPSAQTLDLVNDTFCQFVVFLADEHDVAYWLPTLKRYCYGLMDRLDRPNWQVDWCLRSPEFTRFAIGAQA